MNTCLTCAHYEYLHEYEVYMCNAQNHPLREETVEWKDECDFYDEYNEVPDILED